MKITVYLLSIVLVIVSIVYFVTYSELRSENKRMNDVLRSDLVQSVNMQSQSLNVMANRLRNNEDVIIDGRSMREISLLSSLSSRLAKTSPMGDGGIVDSISWTTRSLETFLVRVEEYQENQEPFRGHCPDVVIETREDIYDEIMRYKELFGSEKYPNFISWEQFVNSWEVNNFTDCDI